MSKIKILSEHLANQIAAGEVVERPASVVKELIENSLDAGASQITIQVAGNGTRMIRVADNGEGMDSDDLLLCLERHATSKLGPRPETVNQLAAISTLGFRGEAIPSIASVARLNVTSRPANAALGTRAELRYGKILKVHECGCSQGTVFEVQDLFGNVPARKKFLKSNRTELYHIEEIIKNYALINHHCGFLYSVDERTVLDLPAGTDSPDARLRRLITYQGPLLPIASPANRNNVDPDQCQVSGLLLPPDQESGTQLRLRLFVNGRAIRDRQLYHAVADGLAGFLMKNKQPAGALFLELPPAAVDVNVHPTKQEIRFRQPEQVRQQVSAAVRQAILRFQDDLKFSLFRQPPASTAGQQPRDHAGLRTAAGTTRPNMPVTLFPTPATGEPPPRFSYEYSPTAPLPPIAAASADAVSPAAENPTPASLVPIGQLFELYILCERFDGTERSLVLIDQHAVHERIIFETLKSNLAAAPLASQALLFPEMIELDPEQHDTATRCLPVLERLGLHLEAFGGATFLIKAIPAVLSHLPPAEILASVLDRLPAAGAAEMNMTNAGTLPGYVDEILAGIACKAAVKAGDPLKPPEIEALLQRIRTSDVFSHCPHGRPVVKTISAAEIRKWFHRP